MSSGREWVDDETAIQSGVEGAVATELQSVFESGQADEEERQERRGVPRIVEQDVQMVERVLMKQWPRRGEGRGGVGLWRSPRPASSRRKRRQRR